MKAIQMDEPKRGRLLTFFMLSFLLMSFSNFSKSFSENPRVGMVFFGIRLHGTENHLIAPLFGMFLLIYAAAIWRMKWYALPLAWIYAAYVISNMVLFRFRSAPLLTEHSLAFLIVYFIVAAGVSCGCALLLTAHRAELT
jgi:hypothetical protein